MLFSVVAFTDFTGSHLVGLGVLVVALCVFTWGFLGRGTAMSVRRQQPSLREDVQKSARSFQCMSEPLWPDFAHVA